MRRKLHFFLFLFLLISVQGYGQTWSASLVTGKLSVGTAKYLKMDMYADTIYIAFADGCNGGGMRSQQCKLLCTVVTPELIAISAVLQTCCSAC